MKTEILIFALVFIGLIGIASAADATVCCEKTLSGFYCQDVPASECASDSRQVPTACESTSFCKQGYCYDSSEGTCLDNTPQNVCNLNNGTWSETFPAQCSLGCCILGDQASFVTLTRCKKLSSFLGLQTNYNKGITNEVQCVLSAGGQEKGACVYDFEFEKTCKFVTRGECQSGTGAGKGEFFAGKLCSDEELGTNCGPTDTTTCVPGKDEVYFADSCGNPANIYDASKVKDKDYWSNVYTASESCNPDGSNANSKTCGNCNYILGSICRTAERNNQPNYGDYMCIDLNCKDTSNGKSYKHGESWCVYDDEGDTGVGKNSVGSRFYKHICINGEEVLEQCADFRQEECIENNVEDVSVTYSQAACRVNRWQDCLAQTDKADCQNTDKRDCLWKEGLTLTGIKNESNNATCIPKNPPGLKFWEGEETKSICAQASVNCIVKFEKTEKLIGGDSNYKCTQNCECFGLKKGQEVSKINDLKADEKWLKERQTMCFAMGDCGPNVNWIGDKGYKAGYNVTITKYTGKIAPGTSTVTSGSSGPSTTGTNTGQRFPETTSGTDLQGSGTGTA